MDQMALLVHCVCALVFVVWSTYAYNGGSSYKSDHTLLAVTESGTGVSWGSNSAYDYLEDSLVGIEAVATTTGASAVLLNTSKIITFGQDTRGGILPDSVPSTGVKSVSATIYSFAALYLNGSVRAWGDPYTGGSPNLCICTSSNVCDNSTCLGAPLEGVEEVFACDWSFAVIMSGTRTVKSWGRADRGGDSSSVSTALNEGGFVTIISAGASFCAVKSSGTVVCWGSVTESGITRTSPYTTIFSNWHAYAGLTVTGKLEAWGNSDNGGITPTIPADARVVRVFSSNSAFAALLNDGSLVC